MQDTKAAMAAMDTLMVRLDEHLAREHRAEVARKNAPRCARCGVIATMTASLGPACPAHYDDLAG